MKIRASVVAMLVPLFFASGCSTNDNQANKPSTVKVVDTAGILTKKVVRKIEDTYAFPPDSPVLVRTIKTLKRSEASAVATDMMQAEGYWESVRPKRFWEKMTGDKPEATGTYILVSQEPRLIQIRFGERVRLQAYRAGLAVGDRYLTIQTRYLSGALSPDAALKEALDTMSSAMRNRFELPWYLKGLIAATGAVELFKDFAVPHEGFYKKYVFTPFASLSVPIAAAIGSSNSVPLANALTYWGLRLVLVGLVLNLILRTTLPQSKHYVISVVAALAVLTISIAVAFPSLGLSLLLSQGRLEDKFILDELGISLPSITAMNSVYLSVDSGYWIAGAVAILFFLKSNISNVEAYYFGMLSAEKQQNLFKAIEGTFFGMTMSAVVPSSNYADTKMMEKTPYRAVSQYLAGNSLTSAFKWFVFLLFMPQAIAIYTGAIFAPPLLFGLLMVPAKVSRARKKSGAI